ncbi:LL-diaminopimelate aminotransferase [bioreactor metagenome]|uniref:LL-diaminopimelate aminotransferase n=1 Tax=bioreactor metagenome TaxID=1076179 RepID=A0A644U866_9ZZZZ|nr:aminotransferase class I/II-fold pyridoxal phosphate-dependent enzyme [Negativicutes bacterium]
MVQQADRMRGLTSAIFSEIADLQKKAIASGKDVIQLSIGSPDLAPAPHIIEALKSGAEASDSYGYTLTKGRPELLTAIADWYKTKFGVELDADSEVHSLIGSQEGLAHISLCLANPGDYVLIPDPGYPIYSAGPLVAGANLHRMCLTPENGFLPDLDAIDESILKQTKLMILNYPNNPLAATATPEFFAKVVALANRYDFIVCHDFAYSELVFDGYRQASFLSVPGAKEVGIEFNSLSKTYSMCGCRVGYVVGNAEVISLLSRLKSNFDYGVFAPIQQAAVAALTGPQDCVDNTVAIYQRRRDILVDGLNQAGWKVEKPKASMYIWAKVPTGQSSFDFTVDLLNNTGVAVIPGIAFGDCGEGYVRIALVQPEERISEAAARIKQWLR